MLPTARVLCGFARGFARTACPEFSCRKRAPGAQKFSSFQDPTTHAARTRTHEGHQLVPGLVVARTAATPWIPGDLGRQADLVQLVQTSGLNETIVCPWSKLNHTSDASPSPGFQSAGPCSLA